MPLSEHVYCEAVTFKMTALYFALSLNSPPMETIQIIHNDVGDDAMSVVQIKVWHKHFKDG